MSWNIQKAGVRNYRGVEILNALKSFGSIFALQETEFIPNAELERLRWERRCSSDARTTTTKIKF